MSAPTRRLIARSYRRGHGRHDPVLRITPVRLRRASGLDGTFRPDWGLTFDDIGGVPLSEIARWADRKVYTVQDGPRVSIWLRTGWHHKEAAVFAGARVEERLADDDPDYLTQSHWKVGNGEFWRVSYSRQLTVHCAAGRFVNFQAGRAREVVH